MAILRRSAMSICLLIAIAACSETHDPDWQSSSEQTTDGQLLAKTIRWEPERPVIRTIEVQGERLADGGCSIGHTVVLKKGEAVWESVLEYRPVTCTFLLARHPVDSVLEAAKAKSIERAPAQSSGDYGTFIDTKEIEYEGGGGGPLGPMMSSSQVCDTQVGDAAAPYQKVWYEDPPNWDMNSSEMDGYFFYNGDCVQYARTIHKGKWLARTGWDIVQHYHFLSEMDSEWSWVRAQGYSKYVNSTFCAGIDTYTRYWPNEVRMFKDGHVAFTFSAHAWEGCYYLLHLEHISYVL